MIAGFRQYKRIDYTPTQGIVKLSDTGMHVIIEVTANETADINFFPNIAEGWANGGGIPVKAGQTRQIPMTVYNFQADGDCTVVAYGL
jgi:hypothetical protein